MKCSLDKDLAAPGMRRTDVMPLCAPDGPAGPRKGHPQAHSAHDSGFCLRAMSPSSG